MQKCRFLLFTPVLPSALAQPTESLPVITPYLYQRILDLAAACAGCALLLLMIPWVWVANWWWAPGPLFYRQWRVGRHGQIFQMLKFRSMVIDAERNGVAWTAVADPRITRVGHFLRRTHLDELPQCWNILRGEMSLIGPRPERPEFVALLVQQLEDYAKRHSINPGLTGWAQVNYEYGDSVEDAAIKLRYDLAYISQRSWQLDLTILLRTFTVLWKGR